MATRGGASNIFFFWGGGGEVVALIYLSRQPLHTYIHICIHTFFYYIYTHIHIHTFLFDKLYVYTHSIKKKKKKRKKRKEKKKKRERAWYLQSKLWQPDTLQIVVFGTQLICMWAISWSYRFGPKLYLVHVSTRPYFQVFPFHFPLCTLVFPSVFPSISLSPLVFFPTNIYNVHLLLIL